MIIILNKLLTIKLVSEFTNVRNRFLNIRAMAVQSIRSQRSNHSSLPTATRRLNSGR